jgi:hypothetical protein
LLAFRRNAEEQALQALHRHNGSADAIAHLDYSIKNLTDMIAIRREQREKLEQFQHHQPEYIAHLRSLTPEQLEAFVAKLTQQRASGAKSFRIGSDGMPVAPIKRRRFAEPAPVGGSYAPAGDGRLGWWDLEGPERARTGVCSLSGAAARPPAASKPPKPASLPSETFLPKAFGIRPRAVRLDGELSDPRLNGYGR